MTPSPTSKKQSTVVLALLIPLAVAVATVVAWWSLLSEVRAEERQRFQTLASQATQQLAERLKDYRDVLWSARGLFNASRSVELLEWRAYVDALKLSERHPGLMGLGFIEVVPGARHERFLAETRADHAPDFAIHPPGERDEQFIIRFIEPLALNLRARGYDIASEALRRRAAEDARDSGDDRLTAAVILTQDDRRGAGFLLLVPVYANGAEIDTLGQRRAAHIGWVYAPFIGERMLAPIADALGPEVALRATDGGSVICNNLARAAPDALRQENSIDFAGRRWWLSFASTPAFRPSPAHVEPWLTLVAGLVLSALLAALMRSLQNTRDQAMASAERSTTDLRASEERWRNAVEVINDGVWDLDPAANRVSMSQHWTTRLGYRPEEIGTTTEAWWAVIHPDDREQAQRLFAAYLASRDEEVTVELRFLRKDGGFLWALVRGRALRDADGRALRVLGSNTDITKRKLGDAQLLASEEKFRALFENSPIGMALCHGDGGLISANRAFRDLFGAVRDLRILSAGTTVAPWMAAAVDGGRFGPIEHSLPGREAPVLLSGMGVTAADGERLAWVLVEDTTLRRRAEAALRLSLEAAESSNRAKSEFLATMSHEIRTPMNGVIGMSRLLLQTRLSTEQREFATVIHTSADNLLALLNDILDFSKIEAGRLELEQVPFDLRALLNDVVAVMAERIAERGLACAVTVAPEVPAGLIGDPLRLRQVVLNLLSNAIKFTSAGRIGLGARMAGGQVALTVSDTGIGISPEVMPRLFHAFSQADSSTTRRFGGTGLGLAICRRLAEAMGGTISAGNAVGGGSVFTVTLPLPPTTSAPVVRQPIAAAGGEPRSGSHAVPIHPGALASTRVPVLVAEDNVINQKVAAGMLRRLGYRCVIASNGREALDAVDEAERAGRPFAAVLMDCQMPIMDGFAATAALRGREAGGGRRLPIIALTANAFASDRDRCLAAGMDAFLPKPLDPVALASTLADLLTPASTPPRMPIQPPPLAAATGADFDPLPLAHLRQATGDPQVVSDVLRVFRGSASTQCDAVVAAARSEDAEALMRLAHGFKGGCQSVGLSATADAASRIELAARSGDLAGARAAVSALPTIFLRGRAALDTAYPETRRWARPGDGAVPPG